MIRLKKGMMMIVMSVYYYNYDGQLIWDYDYEQ